MYAETLSIVDWLIDIESYPEKEGVLPPEEFKDFIFDLYNELILEKQIISSSYISQSFINLQDRDSQPLFL